MCVPQFARDITPDVGSLLPDKQYYMNGDHKICIGKAFQTYFQTDIVNMEKNGASSSELMV